MFFGDKIAVMSMRRFLSARSRVPAISFTPHRVVAIILLGLALQGMTKLANAAQPPDAGTPAGVQPGKRAFPHISLATGRQLDYVGSFSADGKFKALTKFSLFVDSMKTASSSDRPVVTPDQQLKREDEIMKQVPPNIELRQNEEMLEDFQPPEHAVKEAKGHSVLEDLRDSVVTLAYGANRVLLSPQFVTTDSQHRVIVTDAAAHGLHVLAYNAKDSFQIVGGPGRRLQSPSGVAVDNDDNIYISDSERGMVLVYDSAGRFMHVIGTVDGEGLFERPSGIAIDCKTGHLYVLDPPRHTLFILDLQGKVLARLGTQEAAGIAFSSRSGSDQPGRFLHPQSVLVHNDELIVLDLPRIHILNLQGEFLKEFKITNSANLRDGPDPGVFMDAENHIYISDPGGGTVREYSHDGQLLGAFGQFGIRMGEFCSPSGMWVDSAGRMYIVDNHRVQIFQLSGVK